MASDGAAHDSLAELDYEYDEIVLADRDQQSPIERIDRYYPVAQDLVDGLEELEDIIVDNPHPEALARIHAYRRQLVVLRRVGWP